MDIAAYIAALLRMQLESTSILLSPLQGIADGIADKIIDWALDHLSFPNRSAVVDPEAVKALNNFDAFMHQTISSNTTYNGAVSKFIQSLPRLKYLIIDFQTFFNDLSFTESLVNQNEKLVVNEIINSLLGNGFNAGFTQPMRDLIYRQIVSGASQRQIKTIIQQWVAGDESMGHFGSYIEQTSQMAVELYPAMINKKLMQTFNYPYLFMTGSLIQTSSPQCRRVVKHYDGVISRETFADDLEPLAKRYGLIENTNFDNLTFNKLHYGCRHEFTPMMLDPTQIKK